MRVYADYNATTPLNPQVIRYLEKRFRGPFANPNSIHSLGLKVKRGMEEARLICANVLGAEPGNIIFNSGASEGISHILYSLLDHGPTDGKNIIITSSGEHSAIYQGLKHYQNKGFEIQEIPVLESGVIDFDAYSNYIEQNCDQVALVVIMAANNETGVIWPYKKIGKMASKFDIPYFADTTQLIGKVSFNFDQSFIDYAVVSGHKIGALTGTGLMLIRNPATLKTFIHGGGQEQGLRNGTQNYLGNETLAVALQDFFDNISEFDRLKEHKESFESKIKEKFSQVKIIGEKAPRLPGTTLLACYGLHSQAIQIELESNDIFVTTSSACSDNEPRTSRILAGMKLDDALGRSVVRIGLGIENSKESYEIIYQALDKAYTHLSKLNSF